MKGIGERTKGREKFRAIRKGERERESIRGSLESGGNKEEGKKISI